MELDDAYAIGAHIADGDAFPARWAKAAETFRAQTQHLHDLPYGEGPRRVLDLFFPPRLPKGTVVFVHGGYWRNFDKSSWSHLAAGPLAHGWAVAIPSYELCPDASIAQITQQVQSAIGMVAERTVGPLRLTGHSAGAHLVARMLDPALQASWADRVEKVVLISPLADLVPLLRTSMNADFQLDEAEARDQSPVHQPAPKVPVTVWVGADERPVFVDQAQTLAAAWGCPREVEAGRHHFDVIDGLTDPDSALMAALLSPVD